MYDDVCSQSPSRLQQLLTSARLSFSWRKYLYNKKELLLIFVIVFLLASIFFAFLCRVISIKRCSEDIPEVPVMVDLRKLKAFRVDEIYGWLSKVSIQLFNLTVIAKMPNAAERTTATMTPETRRNSFFSRTIDVNLLGGALKTISKLSTVIDLIRWLNSRKRGNNRKRKMKHFLC